MKVGVIGYSMDNGHPFSFSAIINGFNEDFFHLNPIKPINEYLKIQPSDAFGIENWNVTHIWTQDNKLTHAISKYANIPNPVDDYHEMINEIDVVLILRDDLHQEIAKPFLEKKKFVFIDKPLASNQKELSFFMPYLENGQLMSCSGLRYFPKVEKILKSREQKNISFAYCSTIDNWLNYGIHSIEGLIPLIHSDVEYIQFIGDLPLINLFKIVFKSGSYILVNLSNKYNGGIRTHLYYDSQKPIEIVYNDNFNSFRNTLKAFALQVKSGKPAIDPSQTITLMNILFGGEESKKNGGKKISLNEY